MTPPTGADIWHGFVNYIINGGCNIVLWVGGLMFVFTVLMPALGLGGAKPDGNDKATTSPTVCVWCATDTGLERPFTCPKCGAPNVEKE